MTQQICTNDMDAVGEGGSNLCIVQCTYSLLVVSEVLFWSISTYLYPSHTTLIHFCKLRYTPIGCCIVPHAHISPQSLFYLYFYNIHGQV